MIKTGFTKTGSYVKLNSYLLKMSKKRMDKILDECGRMGVDSLRENTPVETGLTSASWTYTVVNNRNGKYDIVWTNTNLKNGVPVAVLLRFGHGTGTGGYVQGRDYITPAMEPVFEKIKLMLQREVSK